MAQLIGMVKAWGYCLEPTPQDAPPPAISAERATEIAGLELLNMLRMNALPSQDPASPDGLLRGLVFDPNDNSTHVVWVVTYCRDDAAPPGDCPKWENHMIDDQTGMRVTSFNQD